MGDQRPDPPATAVSRRTRRALVVGLQAAASALVLWLILRQVDLGGTLELLATAGIGWVALAVACRAYGVTSRVARIGIGLTPWGRAPVFPLLGIGYLAALLNQVLPARAGDLVALGLLRRELGFGLGPGAAAILTTNLVTGVVTSAVFLLVLVRGLTQWQEAVGDDTIGSLSWIAVAGLLALLALAALVRLGARLRPGGSGLGGTVRSIARDAGQGLGAWRPLLANIGLFVIQLAIALLGMGALLFALDIQLTLPLVGLVAFLVLNNALSSVLPALFGASSAASGLAVLLLLGATEDQAVAFAMLAWLVRTLPIVFLGAWPLWHRVGQLGELLDRSGGSERA